MRWYTYVGVCGLCPHNNTLANQIAKKPVRAPPPGGFHDVTLTLGISLLPVESYERSVEAIVAAALSFVLPIDELAVLEVVDVIRCPCSAKRQGAE